MKNDSTFPRERKPQVRRARRSQGYDRRRRRRRGDRRPPHAWDHRQRTRRSSVDSEENRRNGEPSRVLPLAAMRCPWLACCAAVNSLRPGCPTTITKLYAIWSEGAKMPLKTRCERGTAWVSSCCAGCDGAGGRACLVGTSPPMAHRTRVGETSPAAGLYRVPPGPRRSRRPHRPVRTASRIEADSLSKGRGVRHRLTSKLPRARTALASQGAA
jgi:hypothetical protein